MQTKKCSKCNLSLKLTCFHKNKSRKDGHNCYCKVCFKKVRIESDKKTKLKTNGLYSTWRGIKDRCQNKKHIRYSRYGGRGIRVCEEWQNNFNSFYKWAVNNGHKKGLQIDRINNDGNYEPYNCRFVTSSIINQNRISTKLNEKFIQEIKKMLKEGRKRKEIAKLYKVSKSTIFRINNGTTWKNILI